MKKRERILWITGDVVFAVICSVGTHNPLVISTFVLGVSAGFLLRPLLIHEEQIAQKGGE